MLESIDADDVFRGLTDPTRRAILSLLSSSPTMSVNEIAGHFPEIGRTAISSHLRILREAELVAEVKDGRHRLYRLGPNRADSAVEFLRQVYSTSVSTMQDAEAGAHRRKGPGRPSRASRAS